MQNFGPIVDILLGIVGNAWQDRSTGSSIPPLQLVGDDPKRLLAWLWCKLGSGARLAGFFRIECPRFGSSGERCTPQFRHGCSATTKLARLELALLDLFRQLDSTNGDHRVVESFEPQHRPNPLFDSPVVLFDEVVQVL